MKYDMENEKKNLELENIFKTFSNKHRIEIIKFLKNKKESSVGSISDNISASFQATSKHLSVLEKAGILNSRYDGSFVMYKISENTPEIIYKFLNLI